MKLRESISQYVRLTWDRAQLRGIREARRLLAQGLAFNDTSVFLLLELLKLEGISADFFAKRVAARFDRAEKDEAVEQSAAEDRKMILPQKKEDDIAFVSLHYLNASFVCI